MVFKTPESSYPPRLKMLTHADVYGTPHVFLHDDFEGPPLTEPADIHPVERSYPHPEGEPAPIWWEFVIVLLGSGVLGAILVLAIWLSSRWIG